MSSADGLLSIFPSLLISYGAYFDDNLPTLFDCHFNSFASNQNRLGFGFSAVDGFDSDAAVAANLVMDGVGGAASTQWDNKFE